MRHTVGSLAILTYLMLSTWAHPMESSNNYILNGKTANPGQFPHQVSLRNTQNQHFCGATLISNRWLLSAAHCTSGPYFYPSNVRAWIAAHFRQDGIPYTIDAIVNHPQFDTQTLNHDISLLRASSFINFHEGRIQPARLPTVDYADGIRSRAWISGWGFTRVNQKL